MFQIYLTRQPNFRKKLLNPCVLDAPNPKCYVCSEKPEVTVRLNTTAITIKTLEDKVGMLCVLKKTLYNIRWMKTKPIEAVTAV